jgi:uncharacterized protein YqjF (DUF2071 family)
MTAPVFLTARWRHLAMVNWAIDPALLAGRVPAGCELDFFDGRTYVSAVGFMMEDTRVLGVPVPFHRTFEEVNLRFYVRRLGPEGWRRGVSFVKEIVPKAAIAYTARLLYNEPYVALPMRHTIDDARVGFGWQLDARWCELEANPTGPNEPLAPGSEAEFIAEHYWGYTAQRDGSTIEYQVEHPPWRARVVASSRLDAPVAALWGPEFEAVLAAPPTSAFLAEGSAVKVRAGVRVPLG